MPPQEPCVLSPEVPPVSLHAHLGQDLVGLAGFDLGDGLPRLLDFRFADDPNVLLVTTSKHEARRSLDLLRTHAAAP